MTLVDVLKLMKNDAIIDICNDKSYLFSMKPSRAVVYLNSTFLKSEVIEIKCSYTKTLRVIVGSVATH